MRKDPPAGKGSRDRVTDLVKFRDNWPSDMGPKKKLISAEEAAKQIRQQFGKNLSVLAD